MAYHLSHAHGITRKIEENSEDEHPQEALVEFSKADQDRIDSKLYVLTNFSFSWLFHLFI